MNSIISKLRRIARQAWASMKATHFRKTLLKLSRLVIFLFLSIMLEMVVIDPFKEWLLLTTM